VTGMAVDGLGRVHPPIMNGARLLVETQTNRVCVTSHPHITAVISGVIIGPTCTVALSNSSSVMSTNAEYSYRSPSTFDGSNGGALVDI
jgi:hypothetical protein